MNSRDYLSFTKRERTGILTLIAILIIAVFVPKLFFRHRPVAENIKPEELNALRSKAKYHDDHPHLKSRDSTIWKHDNYWRSRDVKNSTKKFSHPLYYRQHRQNYPTYTKPHKPPAVIDVNTADTTAFIALPGIGSKLASRIVLFREKLGGFYDVKQIGEVYGLQDSIYRRILPVLKCDSGQIRRIEINNADKEVLKSHPYIRWNTANALIAYRNQHGSFHTPHDLERINNIDADALRKLIPYLSFN